MAQVRNPGGDDINIPAFGLAIPAGATVDVDDSVAAELAGNPAVEIVEQPAAQTVPVAEAPAVAVPEPVKEQ